MSEPFELKIRTKEIGRLSFTYFDDYSYIMRHHVGMLLGYMDVKIQKDDDNAILSFHVPFNSTLTNVHLIAFLSYLKGMDNA